MSWFPNRGSDETGIIVQVQPGEERSAVSGWSDRALGFV